MRTRFDLSVKFTRVVCELKIYKTKTEILKAIFDFSARIFACGDFVAEEI